MDKMLVVAKDTIYRTQLVQIFRQAGYNVHAVSTKLDGIAFFLQNEYDMLLASAAVDDAAVFAFLMRLKALKSTITVGMIMSGAADDLLLTAIASNLDFYCQQRLPVAELLKQWERMLRRNKAAQGQRNQTLYVAAEHLLVDLSAHVAYQNEKRLQLNVKEYQLLVSLLKNKGTAVSRFALFAVMDRNQRKVNLRLVDKYVKNLRNKLSTNAIIAVRGYGYKWQV